MRITGRKLQQERDAIFVAHKPSLNARPLPPPPGAPSQ
jgi:hypothetical protein